MSVIEIKPSTINDTIEYLDDLLVRSKSGEIHGVVVIIRYSDGTTGSGWANIKRDSVSVIGELEVLKRDIMDLLVSLRVDPQTGSTD